MISDDEGSSLTDQVTAGAFGELPDTAPRRLPTHAKGRRTVQRILDAAVELILESGYEAMTTGRIAERAEVNIATVYKYFPNKIAIYMEILRRNNDGWLETVQPILERCMPTRDWRTALAAIIEDIVERRRSTPTTRAVRLALKLSWELIPVSEFLRTTNAGRFANFLSATMGVSALEGKVAAGTVISLVDAMLDNWMLAGDLEDRFWIEEAHRVTKAYLASRERPAQT